MTPIDSDPPVAPGPDGELATGRSDDDLVEQAELEKLAASVRAKLEEIATSDRAQIIRQLLELNLAGDIGELTFDAISDSLALVMEESAWSALLTVARGVDAEEWTSSLEALDPPPAAREFLVSLLALYGPRLRYAMAVSGRWRDVDDWQSTRRRVVRDVQSGDYAISVTIKKVIGDEFTITGPPGSMIRLAIHILRAVALVDDSAALTSGAIRDLRQAVDQLSEDPKRDVG